MNNIGAGGSGNDASSGEAGNEALESGADTASLAGAGAGVAVGSDTADVDSSALGFVEDVIGSGYGEPLTFEGGTFVDGSGNDASSGPRGGGEVPGIAESDCLTISPTWFRMRAKRVAASQASCALASTRKATAPS